MEKIDIRHHSNRELYLLIMNTENLYTYFSEETAEAILDLCQDLFVFTSAQYDYAHEQLAEEERID